jgi:hypothetical protein
MDLIMFLVTGLLASSVAVYIWLTLDGLPHRVLRRSVRPAALGALTNGRYPLLPRTIRQTPVD